MGSLIETGMVIAGDSSFPTSVVADVEYWATAVGEFLIIGAQAQGALTVWDITDRDSVIPLQTVPLSADSGTHTLTDLVRLPGSTGDMLLTLGRYDDNYGLYAVGADGRLSLLQAMRDDAGTFDRAHVGTGFAHGDASYFYTAAFGQPGFSVFRMGSGGAVELIQTQQDFGSRLLGDVTALHNDELHGIRMLFAASAFDGGISVFTQQNNGITRPRGAVEPIDGQGFAHVTALDSVQIGPRAFLVAAGSQSDSLSVFRVSQGYRLKLVEHRIDTKETRFEGVQDIEIFQSGGRTFLVAAGADDGVSLFELDWRGRLHHLETIADDFGITLRNASSLSVHGAGDKAHVFVGSESEHGVTELVIDLTRSGEEIRGGRGPQTLTGTDGDDVIWGMGGPDRLYGGAGNDRLIDGRGRDWLTGGEGADIFQFLPDGKVDFITDFEPGIDRIDLTEFSAINHISDLLIGPRLKGAAIIFGDEIIRLINPDGGPYDVSLIGADSFIFG